MSGGGINEQPNYLGVRHEPHSARRSCPFILAKVWRKLWQVSTELLMPIAGRKLSFTHLPKLRP